MNYGHRRGRTRFPSLTADWKMAKRIKSMNYEFRRGRTMADPRPGLKTDTSLKAHEHDVFHCAG
jgi:hypothetical protein